MSLKTTEALQKITQTHSSISLGPKNDHHCLPTQSGGSNEKSNVASVNTEWHTSYNRLPLTQNGCAQPTRFAAQLLITGSALNGVIEPQATQKILHLLTPRHWQDSYEKSAVCETAQKFDYSTTPGSNQIHLIARNISQAILYESTLIREAVYNLQTRYENGQSHTLAQIFKFFECKRVDKALRKYLESDPLSQAIKLETLCEILDLLANGLVSRSKQVREDYLATYEEHFNMLQFAHHWWPVDRQFELARDGICNIPTKEHRRRQNRRRRRKN